MKRNLLVIPMLAVVMLLLFLSSAASAEIAVGISVRVGPPALPVYAQPICPGPGYIWTPGYWAWSDESGYYWVPGTWVVAPVGMLWTPGYWGWNEGLYVWHAGYWGPHVGFYGGINYGFGYGGVGFVGGEWRHGAFFYNRSVTNVNVVHVTNVYNRTVIVNNTRVSYNGGRGGIEARPSREELFAEREPHRGAMAMQAEHEHAASRNRELFASENHGRPGIAATARPGEFRGHGVVQARSAGAPYRAPGMSPREARESASTAGRPGNGRENNRGNEGFHKFGEPQNANNGRGDSRGNSSAQRTNDAWRSSRPNGNSPRPVSQDMPANHSRGNQAEAHGSPHSAPAPHQNAQRPSESRPRENRSGKERDR